MKKALILILFNLIILNCLGQVKLITKLDTVQVHSIIISKVDKKIKRTINNHLKALKEESYCINKKNHIMIIIIKEFDTIDPNKYIGLIDYTEKSNDENYVLGVFIARKTGALMYQLNDTTNHYFYFKYKGWDVYIYTKLDIKFNTKKNKYTIFPIKYREYTLDKEGNLPYEYLNYILDTRDYEDMSTIYKVNKWW